MWTFKQTQIYHFTAAPFSRATVSLRTLPANLLITRGGGYESHRRSIKYLCDEKCFGGRDASKLMRDMEISRVAVACQKQKRFFRFITIVGLYSSFASASFSTSSHPFHPRRTPFILLVKPPVQHILRVQRSKIPQESRPCRIPTLNLHKMRCTICALSHIV